MSMQPTAGVPVQTIGQQMAKVDKCISEVAERLSSLEEKLEPVMRPQPPAVAPLESGRLASSEIMTALQSFDDRLMGLAGRLSEVMDRLEL